MTATAQAAAALLERRRAVGEERSLLAAVSGIDGSGKGLVTHALAAALGRQDAKVANINIDGWLNLPAVRFSARQPAEHFYTHAIRFPQLFEQLVLPLRARRSLHVVADFAEETATAFRPHQYQFEDIDIILLEGIFLLKREHRAHFDMTFWVDCSFETALARALQRGQEGLPPEATIRAYQTIYFPAQRIHFVRDDPRCAADMIIPNDPRLAGAGGAGAAPPPSAEGDGIAPGPGGA